MVKRKSGFTLIEMVIVVAIIALLAGILVPIAFNQVDDAQHARALGDVRAIANAVVLFKKDTGVWPTNARLLYSDGTRARNEGSFEDEAQAEHLERSLRSNQPASVGWKGPYMASFDADPWANRYIVEIFGIVAPGSPYAWVISAGPDGTFQTGRDDTTLQGDDIGILLR